MNLLVVSASAPPKNTAESVQVGRYMQQLVRSNRVTLLTTKSNGDWEPTDDTLQKYNEGLEQIITLSTLPPRLITIIKRVAPSLLVPDNASFFSFRFKYALSLIKQKPDIIFSRSTPHSSAVMAMKLSMHWNVPWIMHLSDPWADNPFNTFSKRNKKKNEQMERECIHQAQLVTLTSKKTISFYSKKYPAMTKKFRFLPNVFDEEYVNQKPVTTEGKMKFVFTGRLYGNRSIHLLLDVAEKIMDMNSEMQEKCEFILAGFFAEESISRIKASKLKNLKYLGPLMMDEALKIQRDATVLIVIDGQSENEIFDLFFPSKLLDYFAARRPIIAFTRKNSTTYELVEGNFGKCFHPENMTELASYMIYLIEQYSSGKEGSFRITSDFTEYSASKNAQRLEKMFNEVLLHA